MFILLIFYGSFLFSKNKFKVVLVFLPFVFKYKNNVFL